MPQYILLLHEPATWLPDISPEEIQAIIQRYKSWSKPLAAKGHLQGGAKLRDGSGRTLRGAAVKDGPYTEGKEVIGGYYLMEAASYDEAALLARDCPHLDYGAIEIREIEPTP